jgi:hypothetical protein
MTAGARTGRLSTTMISLSTHAPNPLTRHRQALPPRLSSDSNQGSSGCTCTVAEFREQFRGTGGLVDTDELLLLLRPKVSQPISQIARWITLEQVLSIKANAGTWFPVFQFAPDFTTLRPGLLSVLDELRPVLGDRGLAHWFCRTNLALNGRAPAELLPRSPTAVWEAARADRFLLVGI